MSNKLNHLRLICINNRKWNYWRFRM